jgi:acetyl esterase/lipase
MAQQVSFNDVLGSPAGTPDAVLHYGPHSLQFGQLWLPDAPAPHPLVVFIHGGCWLNAYDVEHGKPLASALAARGFAVWSVEYRRIGDAGGGWPGTLQDVGSAIDYVRVLAQQFPVDLSRVVLTGHSAGGHLTLWGAARAGFQPDSALYVRDAFVARGAIGLAAIADLALYSAGQSSCEQATLALMGGGSEQHPERYAAASPTRLVPWATPTRLIHGREDGIVPLAQANALAAAAAGSDQQIPITWIDGAGHFDLIHPGTKAFQALLTALDEMAASP